MSVAELALEPRRSLRTRAPEQKQPSSENPSLKQAVNGNKRHLEDDDAPNLAKEDDFDDEDEEEEGGPPPLKKVARSSAGGAIMWKTATGAPKQLAFKKASTLASNGSNLKPAATATVTAAPTNLATALAGILPQPTPSLSNSLSTIVPRRQLIIRQPAAVPRLINNSSAPSTSHLVRRRTDKVNNEICNDCVKALPTLRRSLGRLETRMEAVTSMIKQIVNKHSQQNVAFTRPTINPRNQSIASPSSMNGTRVLGKPTAMRFVPIAGRTAGNTASPSMRKFVAEKSSRLARGSLIYRMISRGLLTYRSAFLTVDEYFKQAPSVIKSHTLKQVQQVMEELVASGLFKKNDDSVDTMDPECIFEKERDLSKLSGLVDYGVSSADFLDGCFDD